MQLNLQVVADEIESRLGTFPWKDVERNLCGMLTLAPNLPRAHFLRYLNAMYYGDFDLASDSLLRYFDYGLQEGGPTPADGSSRPKPHYILLNLAGLHYRFGHIEETISSIHEAIYVGQQAGDRVCVTYALGWLARVLELIEDPSAIAILKQAQTRANDLYLDYFSALTTLSAAKYCLAHLTSFNDDIKDHADNNHHAHMRLSGPLQVHDLITTYGNTSSNHSNTTSIAGGNKGSQISSHSSLMGNCLLLSAASWNLYGHITLEQQALNSFLSMPAWDSTSADVMLAYCKLALVQLRQGNSDRDDCTPVYKVAGLTLLEVKKRYNVVTKIQWYSAMALVLYRRAMHRVEYVLATHFSNILLSLSPIEKDIRSHIEARICCALCLAACEHWYVVLICIIVSVLKVSVVAGKRHCVNLIYY